MKRRYHLRPGDRIHVEGVVTRVERGVATVCLETGEQLYIDLSRACEVCGRPLHILSADEGTHSYGPCPCQPPLLVDTLGEDGR